VFKSGAISQQCSICTVQLRLSSSNLRINWRERRSLLKPYTRLFLQQPTRNLLTVHWIQSSTSLILSILPFLVDWRTVGGGEGLTGFPVLFSRCSLRNLTFILSFLSHCPCTSTFTSRWTTMKPWRRYLPFACCYWSKRQRRVSCSLLVQSERISRK
jgi:hypothetical protein